VCDGYGEVSQVFLNDKQNRDDRAPLQQVALVECVELGVAGLRDLAVANEEAVMSACSHHLHLVFFSLSGRGWGRLEKKIKSHVFKSLSTYSVLDKSTIA